jgi:hypothetical protein
MLAERLGADQLGAVRMHTGPASAAAAERLGARAYTIGRDIHLGAEASAQNEAGRASLLAHEAVHAVQQGVRPVALTGELALSRPGDSAEIEATRIAASIAQPGRPPSRSASLAIRDRVFSGPAAVSQLAVPLIQRDLTGKHTVKDGDFDLNLKTESHAGGSNGMSGTIKFTAGAASPDSSSIKLLQVVRDEDLTTGNDYVWTGGEANRNSMMTTANKAAGVTGGFFVDHSAAAATPRTAKADAAVSPFYRTYWPNSGQSQDGSKKGKAVAEASLWDFPQSGGNRRFTFETAAKAADTGYIYASLHWGFTISDAAKGTVEKEHASADRGPSATFGAAVAAFNKFYKNPGSSTAP